MRLNRRQWKVLWVLTFVISGLLIAAPHRMALQAQSGDGADPYDCLRSTEFDDALAAVTEPALREVITAYYGHDYLRAAALLIPAVLAQPTNSLVSSLGGAVSNAAYFYDFAVNWLTTAIELAPDAGFNYEFRAVAYYNLGQYEQAIADVETALTFYPERAYLYRYRADNYFRLGEQEQALADYNRAIALDPNCIDIYAARAYYFHQMLDYSSALIDLGKALQLDPDNLYALTLSGFVYRQTGELDLALSRLNDALTIDSDYGDAYWGLGYVYEDQGQVADALDAYRRYVELAGDSANPYVLGRIEALEGQVAGESF